MSSINTNNINVNYPVAGINNSTQGFRDNFTSIKTNLDTAGEEISDLQNKAVVKAALNGFEVNNDMANTLISNALTRSFRASTYNLGTNIQGNVTISVPAADVHYGTITANTTFSFGGWSPDGTKSSIELRLAVGNANAFITFPTTSTDINNIPYSGMTYTALLLENYLSNAAPVANTTYTNQISIPNGVQNVNFIISTLNCGNTLDVYPINRPIKSTFIANGTPNVSNVSATGTITAATNTTTVTGVGTLFNTELVAGRVILDSANAVVGTISTIASNTSLTLTANATTAVSGASYRRQLPIGGIGDTTGAIRTDGNSIYLCTANYSGGNTTIWKKITPSSY
jgi:hypothetical protein